MAIPSAAMSIVPGSGPPPTNTTVSCVPSKFVLGLSNGVYCTATLTASEGVTLGITHFTFSSFDISLYHDTGAVVFPQGNECTIPVGNHACKVFVAGTNPGSVFVEASYGGGVNGAPSEGVAYVTVEKYPTAAVVICEPSSFPVGGNSTCAVVVSGGQSPAGTVTFLQYSGTGGITFPGSATCTLTSGSCSLNVTGAISGGVIVQATYGGDADNAMSSNHSASLTVQQTNPPPEREPTTTTVSCAPTSFAEGINSTCTATVSGTGSPSGTVTFSQPSGTGSITLPVPATCILVSGTCTLSVTGAVAGNVTAEASYDGDAANAASSGNQTLIVYPPLATPAVSANATAVDEGQASNLTSQAVTGGIAPYLFQWYEEPPGSAGFTAITGATSPSYTFATSASTERGAWAFELEVNDSGTPVETAFSVPFVVSVNQSLAAPDVSPSSTLVHGGQNISVDVTWSGGTQPYQVDLYNSSISDCSSGYTLVASVSGITGLMTTFHGVAPASATYYCAAVTDSASAPEINASSAPEVLVGHVAIFNASVDGAADVESSTTVLTITTGGSGPDCSGGALATVSQAELPYSTSILTPGTEICYSYGSVVASTSTGKQYTFVSIVGATGSASGLTGRSGSFAIAVDSGINSTYSPQWQTSVSTQVHPGSTVPLGTYVYDTASIGGTAAGLTPTGTFAYSLYSGSQTCEGVQFTQVVKLGADGSVPQSSSEGLPAGTYSFNASYSGDSSYFSSASPCEPFTVMKATPTVGTHLSSAPPLALGSTEQDSATLGGLVVGFVPTGAVTYTLFTASVSCTGTSTSQTVDLTAGIVPNSSVSSLLAAGSYSYYAAYGGDGNYTSAGPSECESVTVLQAATGVTSQVKPSPSVMYRTPAYDTVSISGTVSGFAPTGTVTYGFFISADCEGVPSNQSVALTGGAVPGSSPRASAPGLYSYSATYSGDSNYRGGVGPCEPLVVQTATMTLFICAPSTGMVGVPESCTVFVVNSDTFYGARASGTVTLSGYLPPGMPTTCGLSAGSGGVSVCTFTWTPGTGAAGLYSVAASYGGDPTHAPSSAHAPLPITRRAVSVSVTCSGRRARGAPVTCTVTVTDAGPGLHITPTGAVAFLNRGAGAFSSPTCTLSGTAGTSSCRLTFTPAARGFFVITAVYTGDTNHYLAGASTAFGVT